MGNTASVRGDLSDIYSTQGRLQSEKGGQGGS